MCFFRAALLCLMLALASYGQGAYGTMMTVEADGHGTYNTVMILPGGGMTCSAARLIPKLLPEWKPQQGNVKEGPLCRFVVRLQFTNLDMLAAQLKAMSAPPLLVMSLTQEGGGYFTVHIGKGKTNSTLGGISIPFTPATGVSVTLPKIVEVRGGKGFSERKGTGPQTVELSFPMRGSFDVAVRGLLVQTPPAAPQPAKRTGAGHVILPDWLIPLIAVLGIGAAAFFFWPLIAESLGIGAAEAVAAEGSEAESADAELASEPSISYDSKADARQAFSGDLQTAANRFFRGAKRISRDFKTTELEDGGQRMEFFDPAQTPGYGKRYVQEIDASGALIREYKETIGPDGKIIEVKWVHRGPND